MSALPVIDNQERVLGVVSEADLLLKEEHRAPTATCRWYGPGGVAPNMTRRPRQWSAPHDHGLDPAPTTVVDAGRRMHAAGVKHLPVVDVGDRLVGIMSRADLLKVPNWPVKSDEIIEDVMGREHMMDPYGFFIHVDDGWSRCRAGSSTAASSRIWSAPS